MQADTIRTGGYAGQVRFTDTDQNDSDEIDLKYQAEALANLATATAPDRSTMANLTATIANLTAQLKAKDNECDTLRNTKRNTGNQERT